MTQKKRNKHFWKEKQLIRLRMKDVEINKAIRNQGWVELEEPIRYGKHDPVEKWLNHLLCLDATQNVESLHWGFPHPS